MHQKIVERAKVMWTKEGLSPTEILNQLVYELKQETLDVPQTTALPNDRSTINRWANRGDWAPHWREVRKYLNQAQDEDDQPFSISGIADPIWHLSKTLAYRKAYEYAIDHIWENQEIGAVMMQIQFDVASEYDPPPQVFRKLRPTLRKKVREEKRKRERMIQGDPTLFEELGLEVLPVGNKPDEGGDAIET